MRLRSPHDADLAIDVVRHGLNLKSQFGDDDAIHRFFDEALAAVTRVPGLDTAAWTTQLPLSGDNDVFGITDPETGDGPVGAAYLYAVSRQDVRVHAAV